MRSYCLLPLRDEPHQSAASRPAAERSTTDWRVASGGETMGWWPHGVAAEHGGASPPARPSPAALNDPESRGVAEAGRLEGGSQRVEGRSMGRRPEKQYWVEINK
eukprot:scaffold1644_cov89-Isochrysis_galbana.AAC.4